MNREILDELCYVVSERYQDPTYNPISQKAMDRAKQKEALKRWKRGSPVVVHTGKNRKQRRRERKLTKR